jgi:hypothetical protein
MTTRQAMCHAMSGKRSCQKTDPEVREDYCQRRRTINRDARSVVTVCVDILVVFFTAQKARCRLIELQRWLQVSTERGETGEDEVQFSNIKCGWESECLAQLNFAA